MLFRSSFEGMFIKIHNFFLHKKSEIREYKAPRHGLNRAGGLFLRLGALHILSNVGIMAALPTLHWQQKGVNGVAHFYDLLVSVVANVIAYCVCKWFDRHR